MLSNTGPTGTPLPFNTLKTSKTSLLNVENIRKTRLPTMFPWQRNNNMLKASRNDIGVSADQVINNPIMLSMTSLISYSYLTSRTNHDGSYSDPPRPLYLPCCLFYFPITGYRVVAVWPVCASKRHTARVRVSLTPCCVVFWRQDLCCLFV